MKINYLNTALENTVEVYEFYLGAQGFHATLSGKQCITQCNSMKNIYMEN